MRKRGTLVLIALLLAAVVPSAAQAEGWQWTRGNIDDRDRFRRRHGGIALDHATYAKDVGGTQVLLQSPMVGFWYAMAEHFTLSIDWGMAYYRENTGGDKSRTFRFGDPMVSGYYVGRFSNIQLYLGLGMALPAATLPDGDASMVDSPGLELRAYQTAVAARGGWNSFLWIPEAFSLVFPARIESAGSRHLLLAGDFALGIPIFLEGQGSALVLQAAAELGFQSEHFAFGGRFQFFWWALDDRPFLDQMGQLSLEPFMRVDFGKPFLHARLTINLDGPFGFSFDDGPRVWGLHLGGGTEF